MHLETLKVFCDVVESRSFSAAASQNFVTQSAVSNALTVPEPHVLETSASPLDFISPRGDPLASIIIPVHNQFTHTSGCLRAIRLSGHALPDPRC